MVYDLTKLHCRLVEVCKDPSGLHGPGDLLCPAVATSPTFSISLNRFLSENSKN